MLDHPSSASSSRGAGSASPGPAPAGVRLSATAAALPGSGITEVFARGFGRPGLIALWAGEGDLPTPDFVREAAKASLDRGETFYLPQRGMPPLREALAAYDARVYGARSQGGPERFTVTTGGMHAVSIATRLSCDAGDEMLIPTPAWPNFAGACAAAGVRPVFVPMNFSPNGWTLDFERLEGAITERTRAIVVNSPSNPTGWTASLDDLKALLALARRRGLWILADEIYGRFMLNGEARAPSLKDVMEPDDAVLFVQTLSKNWAMTGWRVGWIEAPAALGDTIDSLVQYSTSGIPAFAQRAATAALEGGEDFIASQVARAREGLNALREAFDAIPGAVYAPPAGAFYLFVRMPGVADTRRFAIDLVDKHGLGVAPGTAFGPGGDAFVRLCFLRSRTDLEDAARRFVEAARGP